MCIYHHIGAWTEKIICRKIFSRRIAAHVRFTDVHPMIAQGIQSVGAWNRLQDRMRFAQSQAQMYAADALLFLRHQGLKQRLIQLRGFLNADAFKVLNADAFKLI